MHTHKYTHTSYSCTHTPPFSRTGTSIHTHTHTHTHTFSLSHNKIGIHSHMHVHTSSRVLSLSLTHTHIHLYSCKQLYGVLRRARKEPRSHWERTDRWIKVFILWVRLYLHVHACVHMYVMMQDACTQTRIYLWDGCFADTFLCVYVHAYMHACM